MTRVSCLTVLLEFCQQWDGDNCSFFTGFYKAWVNTHKMLKVGHTTQNVCSRVSPLPATLCTWFLSHIQLFATSGTVAHKAPLSLERFSRQEYWSGLPFPSPGDLRLKSSNSDPNVPRCKMRSVPAQGLVHSPFPPSSPTLLHPPHSQPDTTAPSSKPNTPTQAAVPKSTAPKLP